jgi:hypothetical protein
MKKYVAKLLPAEGEIKEGDSFLYTEDNSISIAEKDNEDLPDMNILNSCSSYQKVELFLCSRDIQAGDKVITEGLLEEREVKYIDKNGTLFFTNGDDCDSIHCCKKIGKVSPDAVWVKDGMEFDEEDVAVIYEPGEDMETEYIPISEWLKYVSRITKGDITTRKLLLSNTTIAFRCPNSPNHFH